MSIIDPNIHSRASQIQKWENFKDEVLLPFIVESELLSNKNATSPNGGHEYHSNHHVVPIYNPCSCSFRCIPFYGYAFPSQTTIINNYPAERRDVREQRRKEEERNNSFLVIAAVSLCVVGILYTGYQMAHSIGQCLNSNRRMTAMRVSWAEIDNIEGLDQDQKAQLDKIVNFRNAYLEKSSSRSFADVAEDAVIIAGLSLAALGAAMSFATPLIASGVVLVVASLITKFVTHQIWPNLQDDAVLARKGKLLAEDAELLYRAQLKFEDSQPVAQPTQDSLYPDLEEMKREIAQIWNINTINIFNPPASAPAMDE